MNDRTKSFIRNFSFTITSNLVVMLVSALTVFIVPKLIGVEEYGYWQLYLFYSAYVTFLQFGWNDGIYLRYGGKQYSDIDKGLFFSQFYLLVLFQFIIASIIFVISALLNLDSNKEFIFQMAALFLFIVNVRYMLLFILQGTNRLKEYSQITIIDRVLYCFLMIVFLLVGVRDYKLMIVFDVIGKLFSLFYALYICRDIVFKRLSAFYFSFTEAIENIKVGIKLMLSNAVSMLCIGVVRFGIERTWDVSTFGKVSLTLSISNFMMIFINAVGIVIFPILRRTDEEKLKHIYENLRTLLMGLLLGVLIVYYPFKVVLLEWLPKYSDSLIYMSLIFPMCVYEGKMALLINTYLKTIRKEKLMLQINLITLILSIIITILSTKIFNNLEVTILSIVIILAFRSIIAEIYLSKILKLSIFKDTVIELIVTVTFILTGWFVNSWVSFLLYVGAYILYLFIKRADIFQTIKTAKVLMRT